MHVLVKHTFEFFTTFAWGIHCLILTYNMCVRATAKFPFNFKSPCLETWFDISTITNGKCYSRTGTKILFELKWYFQHIIFTHIGKIIFNCAKKAGKQTWYLTKYQIHSKKSSQTLSPWNKFYKDFRINIYVVIVLIFKFFFFHKLLYDFVLYFFELVHNLFISSFPYSPKTFYPCARG